MDKSLSSTTAPSYGTIEIETTIKKDENHIETNCQKIEDTEDHLPESFPLLRVVIVCAIFMCESFMFALPIPFVVFMLRDFGYPEEDRGLYAGIILGSFCFAQFTCGFYFGSLSDRIGRRPVLLFGLFGNVISVLAFGFSKNLYMAIASRMISGFLNGNSGVTKTYVAEICRHKHLSRAFNYLTLAWGVGQIFGPMISGWTANAALRFPFLEGTLFQSFPYLLPCILGAIFQLIIFTMAYFFLSESKFKREKLDEELGRAEEEKKIGVGWKETIHVLLVLIKSRSVVVAVACYGLLLFDCLLVDEIVAVWLSTSTQHGGMGFDSKQIGTYYSINGGIVIFLQIFIIPKLGDYFRQIAIFKTGCLLLTVVYIFLFFQNYFLSFGAFILWLAICIFALFKNGGASSVYIASLIMLNDSSPPGKLGAVNGLSMSTASILRAIAPIFGGFLFSWSLSAHYPYPFDYHFVTNFAAGLSCVIMGIGFLYRANEETLSTPLVQPDEELDKMMGREVEK